VVVPQAPLPRLDRLLAARPSSWLEVVGGLPRRLRADLRASGAVGRCGRCSRRASPRSATAGRHRFNCGTLVAHRGGAQRRAGRRRCRSEPVIQPMSAYAPVHVVRVDVLVVTWRARPRGQVPARYFLLSPRFGRWCAWCTSGTAGASAFMENRLDGLPLMLGESSCHEESCPPPSGLRRVLSRDGAPDPALVDSFPSPLLGRPRPRARPSLTFVIGQLCRPGNSRPW